MSNYKKQQTTKIYESLGSIFCDLATMLRPPERLSVSQASEKYIYLNQPGAYVGRWKNSTVPYMVEPMDTFTSRRFSGMVFVGGAQVGKALWVHTPIATPSGWTSMGKLRVGDVIFAETGKPCRVTFATDVMHDHECFRVIFDDGTSIIADADHNWFCDDDVKKCSRVVTTKEIAATVKYRTIRNRYAIKNTIALDLPETQLPIDPYTLGVWLGDGSNSSSHLCLRDEDMLHITERIRSAGHVLKIKHDGDQRSYTVHVDPKSMVSENRLTQKLQDLSLISSPEWSLGKFIPSVYQRASVDQRWDLLRGMNDTDGTVNNRAAVEWSSSDRALVEGYVQLCNGLGIKVHIHEHQPTYTYLGEKLQGKINWRVTWTPQEGDRPFYLQRHLDRLVNGVKKRPTHTQRRRIEAVESVESLPVCCIQVDSPSHLFLAGRQMVPTHNTQALILNTLAYSIKVDPMDMMLVCPTMLDARDFGIRRVDRLHRNSEVIGEMLLPTADADNRFDKQYSTGMLFTLAWPTPSQLAGKPIGRIVLTDRDRMPDDVEGDGEPFDLAAKRTTTFGSYAMTVAESSPSRPVTNLKWIPSSPHEAPPCEGILKLYNRGDRRRWHWPCPNCNEYFEGMFKHLTWDNEAGTTNYDRAQTAKMLCPRCGEGIHSDQRVEMNEWGTWVKDGQAVDKDGRVLGQEPRTSIASFWLRGVAASFTSWRQLVESYLNANDEYIRTGSEEALKKFYNNDLGEPYYPKSQSEMRLPEVLKARAEKMAERMVPAGVRFLLAIIDVQKNRFEVCVFGILPGSPKFDIVVIDRFPIIKSKRTDHDDESLWVKPHTYQEDWDLITEQVIDKEYELDDGSGRKMGIKFVACDSGGRAGATSNAYGYYRKLREEGKNRRFILLKGDHVPNQPRTRISYPDSQRKDMKNAARGDIPVLLLNSNLLKDDLDGRLDCLEPGKGMYRFPDWLSDSFFSELCAEFRGEKGWICADGMHNEQWDLSYYCIGVAVSELIRVEHLNWADPPGWAAEWDRNDLVRKAAETPRFANRVESVYDFAQFGKALA